jgi:hypothetical protein
MIHVLFFLVYIIFILLVITIFLGIIHVIRNFVFMDFILITCFQISMMVLGGFLIFILVSIDFISSGVASWILGFLINFLPNLM